MKKFIAILLTVLMVLSLAACGTEPTATEEETTTAAPTESATETEAETTEPETTEEETQGETKTAPFEVGDATVTYTVEGSSSYATPATANVKIVAGEDVLFNGKVTVTSDNLWVSEFLYAAIDDLGIAQVGVQEGFITTVGSYVAEGANYWMWEYNGNKPTNFAVNQVHVLENDYILLTFVDTNAYFADFSDANPVEHAAFEVGEQTATYEVEGASSYATPTTANVKIMAGEDILFNGKVTVTSDNLWVNEYIYAAIDELGLSQSGVQEGFITAIGSYVCEGNNYWVWEYNGAKPTNFSTNDVHVFPNDYILLTFVDTNEYFQGLY